MNQPGLNYPYYEMHVRDTSGIAFEHWTDSRSVEMHMHGYYELFLISRGSCRHMFAGTETLLIPGDAVIVPPHTAHGFSISKVSSIYNCQFFSEALDSKLIAFLLETLLPDEAPDEDRLIGLSEENEALSQQAIRPNPARRGVIHLNPREYAFVESLFASMFENYDDRQMLYTLKKQKFTEVILLELHQALHRQNRIYRKTADGKELAIGDALAVMEEHLSDPVDINDMAEVYGFSPNHFRKLFREATGLSPVKYMNRLRITRACEYMQQTGMPAGEAAEKVGFTDLNYFSRVFKQVMGCPPSKI
ncbi:MAG: helix-turn-helix transcriptional regulator [Eubacterium sp.]|nr:helix-turn-helix transcriptional regulator [Eubacterium sp.]